MRMSNSSNSPPQGMLLVDRLRRLLPAPRWARSAAETSTVIPSRIRPRWCRHRRKGTSRLGQSTLMSLFQGVSHERSSPDQLGSKYEAEDRAWQGAVLKTTVEQTLIRGLATAGPCSVSGLPQSRSGTSVTGPIVG